MPKQTFFGKEIRRDIRETQVDQIHDILVGEIASGRWKVDSRFPSVTQLVNQSGLSRGSIQKVLARLEEDGLIATQARRGTFVVALEPTQNPAVNGDPKQGAQKVASDDGHRAAADISDLFLTGAAFRASESGDAPIPAPADKSAEVETVPVAIGKPVVSEPDIVESDHGVDVMSPISDVFEEDLNGAGSPVPTIPSPLHIPDEAADPFSPIPKASHPVEPVKVRAEVPVTSESRIGIALIKNDPRIQTDPSDRGGDLLEGLLEMLPEFGYRSSVAYFERAPDWEVISKDGGPFDDPVDGIIALSSGGLVDFTEPPEGCCPVVFVSGAESRALPCVAQDYGIGAYRATRDLISAGHSKIIICPDAGFHAAESAPFINGHREAMKRVGLSCDEDAIAAAAELQGGDFAALRGFLKQFLHVTAILCESTRRATDLIALCDAVGIQIPADLSIVVSGRAPMRGDLSGETFTGFEFPPEKLAHAAMLLLDEIIHTGSSRFTQVKIPPVKIQGSSVARPRR